MTVEIDSTKKKPRRNKNIEWKLSNYIYYDAFIIIGLLYIYIKGITINIWMKMNDIIKAMLGYLNILQKLF